MSKRSDLYASIKGTKQDYSLGLLVDNIPMQMLDNPYCRHLCIASNAALLTASNDIDNTNNVLSITTNQ